jgi:hypothetical protein
MGLHLVINCEGYPIGFAHNMLRKPAQTFVVHAE